MSQFLEQLRKRQQEQAAKEAQVGTANSDSSGVLPDTTQGEAAKPATPPALRQFRIGGKPVSEPAANQVPAAPEPGAVDSSQRAVAATATPQVVGGLGEGPAGPADFQTTLNQFDALCQSAAGIEPMTMANARGFITTIMAELKANPQAADLLIDRDIHNIMTFINATNARAVDSIETKQVKKTKAASKAAIAESTIDSFKAAFFALTAQAAAPTPATDLSTFANTSFGDEEES